MIEKKEVKWEHHIQDEKINLIKELLVEIRGQKEILKEIRDILREK